MNSGYTIKGIIKLKRDFIIYKMILMSCVILFTIYLPFKFNENSLWFLVFMAIVVTLFILCSDLVIYKFLKRVLECLIQKEFDDDEVIYWNDHDLVLSDRFIFTGYFEKDFSCISYREIVSVVRDEYYTRASKKLPQRNIDLIVKLDDGSEKTFHVYYEGWGYFKLKKDIVPLLRKKNPNITVEEAKISPWYHVRKYKDESEKVVMEKSSKKEKKEEFILYNSQVISDDGTISDSQSEKIDRDELYLKIDDRQKRNNIITCFSIFLYFFSVAWLFGSISYFEKTENDVMWFLSTLGIIGVATGLLIFSLATKSKDGKIKYQYKNMPYFYVALFFEAIAIISLIGMDLLNEDIVLGVFISLLGISSAFRYYYRNSRGKRDGQLRLWAKILLTVIVYVISFLVLGFFVAEFDEDTSLDYSKSAIVLYTDEDRARLVSKADDVWYTVTNKYGDKKSYLSVGKDPHNLEFVYESNDDVRILYLYGNDNYAVWNEVSNDKVTCLYYDRSENQTYIILEAEYNDNLPQLFDLGFYKDRVYFEVMDYEKMELQTTEYNIITGEMRVIYTAGIATYSDLTKQSLNVDGNNLLLSTIVNGKLTLLHFNLDEAIDNSYKYEEINFNNQIERILSVSYDKDKYAIYYIFGDEISVSIFNTEGKAESKVKKFSKNILPTNRRILLRNNMLYFVSCNQTKSREVDKYKLVIYDLELKEFQTIDDIFDFNLDGEDLYGLGYYRDNPRTVRLYEISS